MQTPEQRKIWREKNRERIRQYDRDWLAKNGNRKRRSEYERLRIKSKRQQDKQ